MSWRIASALVQLRAEVDARWPDRDRRSDGTIGDANHRNRRSDHNPWVHPPDGGVVTAWDVTSSGGVADAVVELLVASRDPRVKYVIRNRRILSGDGGPSPWRWRPYHGANPHTSHAHISVTPSGCDDTSSWGVSLGATPGARTPPSGSDGYEDYQADVELGTRVLRQGAAGDDVKAVQRAADVRADGFFGPNTDTAVRALQALHALEVDGVVGPKTWAAIAAAQEPVGTMEAMMAGLTDEQARFLERFAEQGVADGVDGQSFAREVLKTHRAFTGMRGGLTRMLGGVSDMESKPRSIMLATVALVREARARGWLVDPTRFRENRTYREDDLEDEDVDEVDR